MNDRDILEEFIKINKFYGAMTLTLKAKEELDKAISNLIAENKELKEKNRKLIDTNIELATTIDSLNTDIKQEYDKGYKDGLRKGLQPQIEKFWIDTNANTIEVKSQFIPRQEIKHILDKAECEDYYCLVDVIEDLSKLLGED